MKKAFYFLSLFCTVVVSCNTVTFNKYEECFQFPMSEVGDTLGTYVEYNVEYYDSFKGNKALTEKMNAAIRDSVFWGAYTGTLPREIKLLPKSITDGDFRSCAVKAALLFHLNEAWCEGLSGAENYYAHHGKYFWKGGDDQDESVPMAWDTQSSGVFLDSYKHFQNYAIEHYHYSGGAHGNTYYTPIVFDLNNGEVVKVTDIIPAEKSAQLLQIAHEKGCSEIDPSLKYEGDRMPEYFTLGESGMEWYLQPYQWGPVVMSFTLSWEDLKPVLSSEITL